MFFSPIFAQETQIRGFANIDTRYTDKEANLLFFLGEQDLFITSQVTDRISFLGESVFKFSSGSQTSFNVSIERLIVSYNFAGNHSILIGKHHTPLSYWNDRYHHGRVLFPTVDRPMLFRYGLIELHTTGIVIQGLNLGEKRFGYQLMIGNGIGASDLADDNKYKSICVEAHAKPLKGMKFGLTGYLDRFSSKARGHDDVVHEEDSLPGYQIRQMTGGLYFKYFRKKFEVLTEAHHMLQQSDSVGQTQNSAFYIYSGYRIKGNWVPYIKYDMLRIDEQELFFDTPNRQLISIGVRYEFSYLAVLKLEFNRSIAEAEPGSNGLFLQMAVGF
jgi:hypothetical protein